MKIIDLLNKIANGEEIPKKIKYDKHIYEYEEGTYDWTYCIENNGTIKFLTTDVFNSYDNILTILNYEVEILEEEKKIPEKIEDIIKECIRLNNIIDELEKWLVEETDNHNKNDFYRLGTEYSLNKLKSLKEGKK